MRRCKQAGWGHLSLNALSDICMWCAPCMGCAVLCCAALLAGRCKLQMMDDLQSAHEQVQACNLDAIRVHRHFMRSGHSVV